MRFGISKKTVFGLVGTALCIGGLGFAASSMLHDGKNATQEWQKNFEEKLKEAGISDKTKRVQMTRTVFVQDEYDPKTMKRESTYKGLELGSVYELHKIQPNGELLIKVPGRDDALWRVSIDTVKAAADNAKLAPTVEKPKPPVYLPSIDGDSDKHAYLKTTQTNIRHYLNEISGIEKGVVSELLEGTKLRVVKYSPNASRVEGPDGKFYIIFNFYLAKDTTGATDHFKNSKAPGFKEEAVKKTPSKPAAKSTATVESAAKSESVTANLPKMDEKAGAAYVINNVTVIMFDPVTYRPIKENVRIPRGTPVEVVSYKANEDLVVVKYPTRPEVYMIDKSNLKPMDLPTIEDSNKINKGTENELKLNRPGELKSGSLNIREANVYAYL